MEERMKMNRLKSVIPCVALCFALEACASNKPLVSDAGVPPEQCATVYFGMNPLHARFVPTIFNGVPLPAKKVMGMTILEDKMTYLIIPAGGQTNITGDLVIIRSYGNKQYTFIGEGMEFSYTFEAGKTYCVESWLDIESEGFLIQRITVGEAGVRIFDDVRFDGQKYAYGEEDDLLAFVPFKVQPEFVRKGLFD
jgi:hypothetical protein